MNEARYGRNGDNQLVHMRPDELQALGLLARASGTQLTTNPETGYPEAWSLPSWVLPAAAIAATVATGGAAAPAAAGAMGAGTAAAGAGAATAAGAGAAGLGAAGATGASGAGLLAAGEAAGAAGGAAAGGGAGLLSAGSSAVPAATAAAPTGLLQTANAGLKAYSPMISAVGTGVNVARSAMSSQPAPSAPPIIQPTGTGAQTLSSIANEQRQGVQNMLAQSSQERLQRKMQRRGY